MKIDALGEVVPDPDVPEWLVSQPVRVGYFPASTLPFVVEGISDDARPEEFIAAIRGFLALGPAEREAAAEHVYKHYLRFADAVEDGEPGSTVNSAATVWKHVHPLAVRVLRRGRRDRKVYVQIEAECDWDVEHGLQVVYREGRQLCRVSSQDGHLTHADAYGLAADRDVIS
jgi:hypothetical protein